jgi:NADPH-dependent glutamate synthase beta subunit-like oxidoreductase/Pyruvate/2-oxoacid:ferredoxin oxidoreductase delta subunit
LSWVIHTHHRLADLVDMSKELCVAIVGQDINALQTALYLAQIGIKVKFITQSPAFVLPTGNQADLSSYWSAVLESIKHPSIELYFNTQNINLSGDKGNFTLKITQQVSYIDYDLCTGCKKCEENCSTRLTQVENGITRTITAIHKPYPGNKSVPSTVLIDKKEIAPCRASCPLGINVQGFVSLIANDKTQEAYELINQSAPLGGILGRLCKHPCEYNCTRSKLDNPVSIRALHRYAYDNANTVTGKPSEMNAPAKAKVAIIGSGPAGLMAAWELKRRGYESTIFESHSTFGGMLATGIPRFRLSREIREREINRLINTGIRIKTGITVGRDINFAYLKERNYKAFFLAIGALKNNKLNLPGEDLSGVIDCMSFLLTLNQMDDIFVGSNIVVIGDGNSAVDSARVAIRKNMGSVKIISWTVPDELTASHDEITEAFEEGVKIEYCAFPVEILGDGDKVIGVRCQRTRLSNQIMKNGKHRPEPIKGTDFIIDADHVIVAIGQSADSSQLNLDGLSIDNASGTIMVNPITLETNIKGIFAGGDCMRGPNNVVDAMSDGLRAAESIDRYLSNVNMEYGRKTDEIKTAVVDLNSIQAYPAKRTEMSYLDIDIRKNGYEETTLGFSQEQAREEAKRCLSCALCSECMECIKVCAAKAIIHDRTQQVGEIKEDIVFDYLEDSNINNKSQNLFENRIDVEGIIRLHSPEEGKSTDVYSSHIGQALKTILNLDFCNEYAKGSSNLANETNYSQTFEDKNIIKAVERNGIFLCRCNGSNSSVIDFNQINKSLSSLHHIAGIWEIEQACTENGANVISEYIRCLGITKAIVASCRCCNYEQVCYSCNDRRILIQRLLNDRLAGTNNLNIEYVNIRELCAWSHKDNSAVATSIAVQNINSALSNSSWGSSKKLVNYPINPKVLFIGGLPENGISARIIETLGYQIVRIDLDCTGTTNIEISGLPGNYNIKVTNGIGIESIQAGAIVIEERILNNSSYRLVKTYVSNLFVRVLNLLKSSEEKTEPEYKYHKFESNLNKAGLFINITDEFNKLNLDNHEIDLAAKILKYLCSKWVKVQQNSVQVNARFCRGCGNCANQCPIIELQEDGKGKLHAFLDQTLCTGCGACTAVCPTNAIGRNFASKNLVDQLLKSQQVIQA